MLVPSSLKIIELGAGSFALKSYLAENVGAAKVFELIIKNKYENMAILKKFRDFIKIKYIVSIVIQLLF
jgi:tRNA A58 N-methylase Trm61